MGWTGPKFQRAPELGADDRTGPAQSGEFMACGCAGSSSATIACACGPSLSFAPPPSAASPSNSATARSVATTAKPVSATSRLRRAPFPRSFTVSRPATRPLHRSAPPELHRATGVRYLVVAANQTMVADGTGTPVIVTTDPITLGDADRVSVVFNVHSVFGASMGFTLAFFSEISNDGSSWVQGGGVSFSTSTAPPIPIPANGLVRAAFLRFRFVFTASGTGEGAACFDMHARIDHA